MKKLLALVAVGGVALAGGQFYSSKVVNDYLDKSTQDLVKGGIPAQHEVIKKGLFKSTVQDSVTVELDGDEAVITVDYDITHLPWGASFEGQAEVQVTTPEYGTQKLFGELLKTDALFNGHFNVLTGGQSRIEVKPFNVKKEGNTLKMEKPFFIEASFNSDITSVSTTAELDAFEMVEDETNNTLVIKGLKLEGDQNGNWPETKEMDADATLTLDQFKFSVKEKDEYFLADDLKLDIETGVNDGLFFYDVKAALARFDGNISRDAFKGKAKGEFRLEGLYVDPFRSMAKDVMAKMKELTQAGNTRQEDIMMEAVAFVVQKDEETLMKNLKESLKKSTPKYTIKHLEIESNIPDFEDLTADLEIKLDTQSIDFDAIKEAVETQNLFAMMAFLDKIEVDLDAKGLPEQAMRAAGVAGDELDVTFREGVLTVNGEERPMF